MTPGRRGRASDDNPARASPEPSRPGETPSGFDVLSRARTAPAPLRPALWAYWCLQMMELIGVNATTDLLEYCLASSEERIRELELDGEREEETELEAEILAGIRHELLERRSGRAA